MTINGAYLFGLCLENDENQFFLPKTYLTNKIKVGLFCFSYVESVFIQLKHDEYLLD